MKKIIAVLLSALLLAAGLVFVTGCDSPEKGFKKWHAAIAEGDLNAANARSVSAMHQMNKLITESMKQNPDAAKKAMKVKVEIVSCTKNGDKATLKVKDGGKEVTVRMVKEGGTWKVEGF